MVHIQKSQHTKSRHAICLQLLLPLPLPLRAEETKEMGGYYPVDPAQEKWVVAPKANRGVQVPTGWVSEVCFEHTPRQTAERAATGSLCPLVPLPPRLRPHASLCRSDGRGQGRG